ncbi:hypothetical protein B0A48_12985 [Cryoendolithus antarcticus]|uniref:Uncharacterized protein n=1 Tax=Cryoendolithus antarcticus TaxID=1507870 RepID=A0A1V8SQT2_9PEZI|nr:hypothetical protein B0A48_12985 [Cryoendolithus antarcticus]
MKTDNYLTSSLEQAAKSPLHYRHGCVIVRGGKVIGQGYNDYRSGFDGGALKHGRVAGSVLSSAAMQELKDKLKKRKEREEKKKPRSQSQQQSFHAFESTSNGAGHRANEPLTMHSEMMAIHSALSASSKLASSTFSREKPCFKLPPTSTVSAALRQPVVASGKFKSAVLKVPHLDMVKGEYKVRGNGFQLEELEDVLGCEEKGRAFQASLGGEKHQKGLVRKQKQQLKLGGKYQYHQGYQYEGNVHHQGLRQQQTQSASKLRDGDGNTRSNNNDHEPDSRSAKIVLEQVKGVEFEKDYKRVRFQIFQLLDSTNIIQSGKMRKEEVQTQHTLMPTGQTTKSKSNANERKKHPRLNGADLYVTRLGRYQRHQPRETKLPALLPAAVPDLATDNDTPPLSRVPSISSSLTSSLSSTTSSLHDELTHSSPAASSASTSSSASDTDMRNCIRVSRPCYRCISYMHAVGIRRVFWTNDAGEWEGGKVAKLMAALGGDGSAEAGVEGGMFVTKHEVLMLKRKMWEEGKGG